MELKGRRYFLDYIVSLQLLLPTRGAIQFCFDSFLCPLHSDHTRFCSFSLLVLVGRVFRGLLELYVLEI